MLTCTDPIAAYGSPVKLFLFFPNRAGGLLPAAKYGVFVLGLTGKTAQPKWYASSLAEVIAFTIDNISYLL